MFFQRLHSRHFPPVHLYLTSCQCRLVMNPELDPDFLKPVYLLPGAFQNVFAFRFFPASLRLKKFTSRSRKCYLPPRLWLSKAYKLTCTHLQCCLIITLSSSVRICKRLHSARRGSLTFDYFIRYFNAVQSESFAEVFLSDENMVISAPTGSGKTVLFELCILRLLQNFLTPEGQFDHIAGSRKTVRHFSHALVDFKRVNVKWMPRYCA